MPSSQQAKLSRSAESLCKLDESRFECTTKTEPTRNLPSQRRSSTPDCSRLLRSHHKVKFAAAPRKDYVDYKPLKSRETARLPMRQLPRQVVPETRYQRLWEALKDRVDFVAFKRVLDGIQTYNYYNRDGTWQTNGIIHDMNASMVEALQCMQALMANTWTDILDS